MKLASYVGTRDGIMGIGNVLIRLRTGGLETHSELMFEAHDGVGDLMPDGTCEPDADGALWHYSSVGLERMPDFSPRRPGSLGGARFKRIVPGDKWAYSALYQDPVEAATRARDMQGSLYDWQAIFMYLFWIIPNKLSRGMCSERIAIILGVDEKDACLFTPRLLRVAVERFSCSIPHSFLPLLVSL